MSSGGKTTRDVRWELTKSWLWLPASILAAVVGAAIWAAIQAGPTASSTVSTPTELSSFESKAPEETPTPASETSPTPEAAPIFKPQPLTIDNALSYGRCRNSAMSGFYWTKEISPIAGVPYTAGVSCNLAYSNATGDLDFLVPQGASRLTVIAGQPDDAENTTMVVRFEVLDAVSGAALASYDLAFGQAQPIDIPVGGVARVTLRASVLSTVDSPRDEMGMAAFAEPTFR